MTIIEDGFYPVGALSVQADKPIRAEDLQAIAATQNRLFQHVTGKKSDGTAATDVGHNHGDQDGAPLPMCWVGSIGEPSASMVNASSTRVPFTRIHSSRDIVDYLKRSASPHPTVHASINSNAFRIWLNGNVETYFSDYRYLTLNDGLNTGRYLFKKATYYSDLGATLVTLWEPLNSVVQGGETVMAYKEEGNDTFYLYLPEGARRLSVFVPMLNTLSGSIETGERLIGIDSSTAQSWWLLRTRLIQGTTTGEWHYHYPRTDWQFLWTNHELDCTGLTAGQVHGFEIEIESNPSSQELSAIHHNPEDMSLWLRDTGGAVKPQSFAVFTNS